MKGDAARLRCICDAFLFFSNLVVGVTHVLLVDTGWLMIIQMHCNVAKACPLPLRSRLNNKLPSTIFFHDSAH